MDPHDWIIYNKLNPEYNQPFVVAMVFIASFYSSPKYWHCWKIPDQIYKSSILSNSRLDIRNNPIILS